MEQLGAEALQVAAGALCGQAGTRGGVEMSEPWWVRHEKLKAQFAPVAREEARRRRRKITEKCFNLPGEQRVCPHLPMRWQGGKLVVSRKVCTIRRCPLERGKER